MNQRARSGGDESAQVARSFSRRYWFRNLFLLPLLGLAWAGRVLLKTVIDDEDALFWATLAGVVGLVVVAIAISVAVWRCPRCSVPIWGEWRPRRCRSCGVELSAE